ncbi:MAG: TonB-dependent receptor [Fusobacteriaceae bacterium]|nr:TonB-dependent receptor [Fusobacteriaceae bacterium]
MKKKLFILALIASSMIYADEFYEDENSVTLDDTVISVTGFSESTKNVAANVTVITSQELEERNIKTVAEALTTLGNISLLSEDYKGATVDLRGQGANAKSNVQVLVDGISINGLDTDHGNVSINTININDIEKIEVIPGGGSVVYGSGTAGGVVNIITKKKLVNNEEKISGIVGGKLGSFDTNLYSATVNGKITDKFELGTSYSKSSSDGYKDGGDYKDENVDVKAKYSISDKQDVTFKYHHFDGESDSATSKDKGDEYTSTYGYSVTDKLKFNLNTGYLSSETKSTNDFTEDKLSIKPKLSYDYPKGNVVIGYDYLDHDVNRTSTSISYDINKLTNSAYIYNRYDIKKFQISTGYRYDKTELTYEQLSGAKPTFKTVYNENAYNLGLNYLYSESGKVYFKTESGFTTPQPRHLIESDSSNNSVFSNVEPEEYITFEVGAEDYIGKTLVKGAVYLTDKDNEIRRWRAKVGSQTLTYVENIDATRRIGADLSLNHILGKLSLTESFNYVDAKVTEGDYEGKYVANVSKITASINGSYKFNEKFDVYTSIIYKDKYYINDTNTGGAMNERIVTNIQGNYNINKDVKLYAGVNNLLNDNYYDSISYSSGVYTYEDGAERNYFVGFNYSF